MMLYVDHIYHNMLNRNKFFYTFYHFYYAGKAVHSKNQNEHNNNIMNKSVYMTLVYCTTNCLTVCSQVIIQ